MDFPFVLFSVLAEQVSEQFLNEGMIVNILKHVGNKKPLTRANSTILCDVSRPDGETNVKKILRKLQISETEILTNKTNNHS